MSYKDVDGVKYWVDDRVLDNLGDPYKAASEMFARDVERYLYREVNADGSANPTYQNPDFLAWAIARFDACKTGSGHPWHLLDYDPQGYGSVVLAPVPPPEDRVSPGSVYDGTLQPVAPPDPMVERGDA